MENKKIRPIAFYLPQFHPIPENDEWWGKGFTEWTNTAKAKPLFRGHYQPNLPSELGFYDLRLPEARETQAALAKEHGIEGFMYWHYWFAGKRILERPFQEVLASKKPDFPFCLGWANETWTGIWHGLKNKILIEQTYPGIEDYERHFHSVLEAFRDERYITVDGKPLFLIYAPFNLPDPRLFIDTWQKLAAENGLKGIYFIALSYFPNEDTQRLFDIGYDGVQAQHIGDSLFHVTRNNLIKRIRRKLWHMGIELRGETFGGVFEYKEIIKYLTTSEETKDNIYPLIIPNWDNSPRSGRKSLVFANSTPDLFRIHIQNVFNVVKNKPFERRLVFIKSWNEWAEGNYMEPDIRYGRQYLEVFKEEIDKL